MLEIILIDAALLVLVAITAIAAVSLRNLVSCVMMLAIYSLLMSLVWVNMDAVDVAFTEAAVGAGISTILLLGALVLTGNREKKERVIHWPALLAVIVTGGALIYGTVDMPAFGDPNAPVHTHPLAVAFTKQNAQKSPTGKSGRISKEHADSHGHADDGTHHEASHEGEYGTEQHGSEQHGTEQHDTAHDDSLVAHADDTHGDHGHGSSDHHGSDYFHGHVSNMVTSVIVSYRAYDTMFETAVIFTAGLGMILLLRGRRGRAEGGGLL